MEEIIANKIDQKAKLRIILMECVLVFLMIVLFPIKSAYATCSFVNGAAKATMIISPVNKTRSPSDTGETSSSYTLSAGNLAKLFNSNAGSYTSLVNCTAGETLIIGNSEFQPDATLPYYLSTNVPGVYLNAQAQVTSHWMYPYNGGNFNLTLPSSGNITGAFLTSNTGVPWYVIGHVVLHGQMLSGGTVNSGLVLSMTTSDGLDILDVYVNSFSISVPSCSVNSYDPAVDLGTAYSQRLNSVGTSSNKTPFSINLSCASTALKPTITFSGNTVDGYPSVLANNGDATGVGVQLLYGNNIITPNVVTSLGQATTTAARDYNFNAQLYQTAATVTAGTVDVSTTFTINYE